MKRGAIGWPWLSSEVPAIWPHRQPLIGRTRHWSTHFHFSFAKFPFGSSNTGKVYLTQAVRVALLSGGARSANLWGWPASEEFHADPPSCSDWRVSSFKAWELSPALLSLFASQLP